MKTDDREFFEQLGNLFYSLAVDRSIEPIEFSELKMIISKDWMAQPQDSDLPIPQNVHFMFVTMDTLQAEGVAAEEAYKSFSGYYSRQREAFTAELVDRIKETATRINAIFPVHNPYKKNHFAELLILLRQRTNVANF